jgi:hypothetical protein
MGCWVFFPAWLYPQSIYLSFEHNPEKKLVLFFPYGVSSRRLGLSSKTKWRRNKIRYPFKKKKQAKIGK